MKANVFLQRGVDQQRNFVSDRYLSSHFICQIYPHVCREVRNQIVRCQKIDRKTFKVISKYEIYWPSFCQLQPIILDTNFLREWQDILDWKAISRRDDLTIDIFREFKDKLDWDILRIWNIAPEYSKYLRNEKIKNEFRREFNVSY